MTAILAYECFADADVFHFLKAVCGLPLAGFHAFGQGEVVNEVLVKRRASIGLVDEDPGRTHHAARDRAQVVLEDHDIAVRRSGERYLLVVKPELEECFLRSAKRVTLASTLPGDPSKLRALLNLPDRRRHDLFRGELRTLHEESLRLHQETFVTGLERAVRGILGL